MKKGPSEESITVLNCRGCESLHEVEFRTFVGKYHYYCKALPNPNQSQGLEYLGGSNRGKDDKPDRIKSHIRCPYREDKA